MTEKTPSNTCVETTRRDFLQRSTATLVGAGVAPGLGAVAGVYAGGSDTIRIGLIGCGGRGSGAAAQAMRADKNCKLVAMGDLFRDKLDTSRANLRQSGGDKFDVKDERCFVGFDAYQGVIESGVDVVLLATPPPFRPEHLKAAVEAGKHVFAEKPVAVDAPGIRSVLVSSRLAQKKNVSLVSGLCWRYHNGLRETIKRVHDGAVGEIVALQANYDRVGCAGAVSRRPGMSEMEWQIRNYPHFLWTSGDYMAKSTLMAIMGRMATYTGQEMTWDQALSSNQNLTPAVYEFGPLPAPPVAVPGVTRFR